MPASITLYKQIHPCQCRGIADIGFKSLVNLRFDNESADQPTSQELATSAQTVGLSYRNLPIDGETMAGDSVRAFAQLIDELPKPVMVFCATGGRAKRLYQSAVISGLI